MPLGVEVGLGPGHIVLDGIQLPLKGGTAFPLFGPCLLWLNGWMDQGATRYEVDLRPGHIVLDWDRAPPPERGTVTPLFSVHAYCHYYCDQTVGVKESNGDVKIPKYVNGSNGMISFLKFTYSAYILSF